MYWIYLPVMKKWLNLHNVDTVSQHWSDDGKELKSVVAMMQSGVRVLIVAPEDMKGLADELFKLRYGKYSGESQSHG